MRLTYTLIAAAVALSACGKAQEKASEKAAEKMLESAMSQDGSKAKVDLSGGTTKVTMTGADGKAAQMEAGNVKITEADVGVPFYPGAKPSEGNSMRIATPEAVNSTVTLTSGDAPDKVAAFYRDKLKARSEGKQFIDMSGGDGGTTLSLADGKTNSAVQVSVNKAESGSEITIVATQPTTK